MGRSKGKLGQAGIMVAFLAVCMTLIVSDVQAEYKDCNGYAGKSVAQYEENVRLNCGHTGRRWSNDYQGHYNWCTGAPQGSLDDEIGYRENELNRCRNNECVEYARSAVAQYEENVRLGCGQGGPRWSDNYEGHYNWCLNAPKSNLENERGSRENRLNICRGEKKPGGGYNPYGN